MNVPGAPLDWHSASSRVAAMLSSLVPTFDIDVPDSVIGFISAWLLFTLTERLKHRRRLRLVRRSLVAELRQAELTLSSMVAKFAAGMADVSRGIKEWRWLVREGMWDRYTGFTEADIAKFSGGKESAQKLSDLSECRRHSRWDSGRLGGHG
jgi:hypothetical protein